MRAILIILLVMTCFVLYPIYILRADTASAPSVIEERSQFPRAVVYEHQTLEGLDCIIIDVIDLSSDDLQNLLDEEQLKIDIEAQLRIAGIHVLDDTEQLSDPRSMAFFCIVIKSIVADQGKYRVNTQSFVMQWGLIPRNDYDLITLVKTWLQWGEVTSSSNDLRSSIRNHNIDITTRFINDFLTANPRE